MPRGTAFDLDVFKTVSATEVKKESETTTTEVWKPVAGKRFRLLGFTIFTSAETVVTLEDETTAFYIIAAPTKATGAFVNFPMEGYLSVKADNKLKWKTLNTGTFTACFYGTEE